VSDDARVLVQTLPGEFTAVRPCTPPRHSYCARPDGGLCSKQELSQAAQAATRDGQDTIPSMDVAEAQDNTVVDQPTTDEIVDEASGPARAGDHLSTRANIDTLTSMSSGDTVTIQVDSSPHKKAVETSGMGDAMELESSQPMHASAGGEAGSMKQQSEQTSKARTATTTEMAHRQPNLRTVNTSCIICGRASVGRCPKCVNRHYCSRNCQVKDWVAHKYFCGSTVPAVSEETTAAAAATAAAVEDDATHPNSRGTTTSVRARMETPAALTAAGVKAPLRGAPGSTRSTEYVTTRSCCCHIAQAAEGHLFTGIEVHGVKIDYNAGGFISIHGLKLPQATIPSLVRQVSQVRSAIFQLARCADRGGAGEDSVDVVQMQMLSLYTGLRRLLDWIELLRARDVDVTLDGVLNVIKECRICHLGTPCWDLLQFYVNLFLGERIHFDRDFRERLRMRVSDAEQILAACCHLSALGEFSAVLAHDITRLKLYMTMWSSTPIESLPEGPGSELDCTLRRIASTERNAASKQTALRDMVSVIEAGGDSDPDIIRRRSDIMRTETDLARNLADGIAHLGQLQRAELSKDEPDATAVITLCLASKALASRSALLRGEKHPPIPGSLHTEVPKAKLKKCGDDFAAARSHYAAGEYLDAIEGFDRCLKAVPTFNLCWYLLANAHRATDTEYGFRQAIKCYRIVLEQNAENVDVHYNLGVSLQELGDWQEAGRSYENVLSLDASYSDAVKRLDFVRARFDDMVSRRKRAASMGVRMSTFAPADAEDDDEEEITIMAESPSQIKVTLPAPRANAKRKRGTATITTSSRRGKRTKGEGRGRGRGRPKKTAAPMGAVDISLDDTSVMMSGPFVPRNMDGAPAEEVDVDGYTFIATEA